MFVNWLAYRWCRKTVDPEEGAAEFGSLHFRSSEMQTSLEPNPFSAAAGPSRMVRFRPRHGWFRESFDRSASPSRSARGRPSPWPSPREGRARGEGICAPAADVSFGSSPPIRIPNVVRPAARIAVAGGWRERFASRSAVGTPQIQRHPHPRLPVGKLRWEPTRPTDSQRHPRPRLLEGRQRREPTQGADPSTRQSSTTPLEPVLVLS